MFWTHLFIVMSDKKSWFWFIISCRYYVDVHVWHFLKNIFVFEVFKKMHILKDFRVFLLFFFFSVCVCVVADGVGGF